ncbi:exo-alpha-sialidase, partial [bacterium]|nr:exo-alpha-sialidase [bacterium]
MAKQNRREFLKIAGSGVAAAILPFSMSSCQQGRKFITPELVSTDIFIPSPQPGIAMLAASFYTGIDDHTLMSVHSKISRADTIDIAFLRRSEDNGRTWSETTEWPTKFEALNGTGRRHHRGWWTDPKTGRCVMIWIEGVLPNDHPLDGMENWTMRYSVSDDAGKTWLFNEQIIHDGPEYNAIHHFPDITVG